MISKLIAFRVPEEVNKIMEKAMREKKLNKTTFMIQAIINLSGYDYIPAQIIKRKVSR